MILSCNSCQKKFIIPDNAIGASGRLVQCSSCGNKWKQLPIKQEVNNTNKAPQLKSVSDNINKTVKKRKVKKRIGPTLYTPEYLTKKHGIEINEKLTKLQKPENKININFGFYSSLIVLAVSGIFILRILYFTQDIIIKKFPITEIYLNYLFESINNLKEIIYNFILG